MSYEKAMVKFNGGAGALLCNSCSIIVSTGKADYRDIEHYCEDCYNKVNQKVEQLQRQLELVDKFKTMLIHSQAEKLQGVYFICGEAGEKDEMGLPDYISVCPAYGLDGIAMYKKHKDYTAPGY